MRIGIVTFHFVNNFGGVLQAYALRRATESVCNASVEIIDYRNWFIRFTDLIRLFPISTNCSEIITGLKTMRKRFQRRERFGTFTKSKNKLSRKYLSFRQICMYPPEDDKYICGSDQIWNPFLTMGVSSVYYLAFEKNMQNKIAYAPSFGTDGVAKRYRERIRKNLLDIGYLSVREKSGQNLIENLTGRTAERLIDPTFLIERKEWEKLGKNPLETDDKYILLYIMQRDMKVYEYAKRIKEQKGMKLVEISRYGYQPGCIDSVLVDVGPAEFLGLFRDAAYICTNSYHGLVYSVIFEKEFCLIPCKRFQARINNILDLLQIDIGKQGGKLTAQYDKERVNNVIREEREKAFKYLKESVGNVDDTFGR